MGAPVAFLNSEQDCTVFAEHRAAASICRIPLSRAAALMRNLSCDRVWIDALFDGFGLPPGRRRKDWVGYVRSFDGAEHIDNVLHGGAKIETAKVESLVSCLLTSAADLGCRLVSVPQVPLSGRRQRSLNRTLAKAAGTCLEGDGARCALVLPVLLTNLDQYQYKRNSDRVLAETERNLSASNAEYLWIVDTSADDQNITSNSRERFKHLLRFHERLHDNLGDACRVIAGPYWAFNLVLWARGWISHPAISMGVGYRYYLSGGFARRRLARVALPPLRRLAKANSKLRGWIEQALAMLSPADEAHEELAQLHANLKVYIDDQEAARKQVASFYAGWLGKFQDMSELTRSLSLYEDLSSAYVIGKSLSQRGKGKLPSAKGYAKHPYAVAETLMLLCL